MNEQPPTYALGFVTLLAGCVIMRVDINDGNFDFLTWSQASFGDFSESDVFSDPKTARSKCEEFYKEPNYLNPAIPPGREPFMQAARTIQAEVAECIRKVDRLRQIKSQKVDDVRHMEL